SADNRPFGRRDLRDANVSGFLASQPECREETLNIRLVIRACAVESDNDIGPSARHDHQALEGSRLTGCRKLKRRKLIVRAARETRALAGGHGAGNFLDEIVAVQFELFVHVDVSGIIGIADQTKKARGIGHENVRVNVALRNLLGISRLLRRDGKYCRETAGFGIMLDPICGNGLRRRKAGQNKQQSYWKESTHGKALPFCK